MSPGQVDRFLGRSSMARCSACGGVDLGTFGVIAHRRDCPRRPCLFCGKEVMPGEKRTLWGVLPATAHLDCAVDFEHDRDKETWDEETW